MKILIAIPFLVSFIIATYSSAKSQEGDRKTHSDQKEALRAYADGDYYFSRNDFDNALKSYEKAESMGVNHSYFYFKKGISYLQTEEYKVSIITLTRSINLMQKDQRMTDFFADMDYKFMRIGTEYIPMMSYVTLEHKYADVYYYRGVAKREVNDEHGAVVDLRKYHSLAGDSTMYSCYSLAMSLALTGEVYSAIRYFNHVIDNADVLDYPYIISQSYYFRGLINYNNGKKAEACRDWSKAAELGVDDAFDKISNYCR